MTRRNCRAHCRVCGQHFGSDGALFAHLGGEQGDREHIDCADDARFSPVTELGTCSLVRGPYPADWKPGDPEREPSRGVTVWREAKKVSEANRETLRQLRERRAA